MNSTLEAERSGAAFATTLRSPKGQRKTRVMIVDDHELVRRGLAALINAEADLDACAGAATAEAALKAIVRRPPDVVVVDVSLQHGEGLALIQRIKAFSPEIRIVALAMYDKPEYIRRICSAGAAALVSKGDLATRLLQAVRRPRTRKTTARTEAAALPRVQSGASRTAAVATKAGARLDEVEREIVSLIGSGLPARSIAVRLHLSVATVELYRRQIRDKLDFPTATQLVEFCVRWVERNGGLVSA